MKTKYIIHSTLILTIFLLTTTGCFKDLDTVPIDPDVTTADKVFEDPEAYKQFLAKLYGGLALSGQQGPAGQADIEGIDEGFGQYLRGYWYHQELPTDEAIIGWNDQTIRDFHYQTWGADDGFIFAFYSRIFYQISLCNEFLRETTPGKLDERDVDDQLRQEIQGFRAEARFLRALSYYHALDAFRNVPFVTEEDAVGSFFPEQIQAPDLFNYIESELLDIAGESGSGTSEVIADARANEYARADKAVVWTLLAKLYLNAESYIGTPRYAESLEYCERVINAGYTLEPEYGHLFLADNHTSNEIIFPIAFDGINTRTFGGTTFIIRAGIGGEMDPTARGVNSGWAGLRTTKEFVGLFPDGAGGGQVVVPNEGNTALYPKLYVPGAYQGWQFNNTETSLSSVEGNNMFEGYKYFPEDKSPFLFTRVPANALILGDNGGDGTLEPNGDTIRVDQAGLYKIVVDLTSNTYSLTRTEWGIIGDATSAGWEQDIDMTWNPELDALEVFLPMTSGEFKFRANDAWDINLGDDEGEAILIEGGANMTIDKEGGYQVILYLDKPDYTYELNLTTFDRRGMFFTEGQQLEIDDVALFTDGYAVDKFKNVNSDGTPGQNAEYPDTDFPMFRLADVLLMASEAILRGGGDRGKAVDYFNQVRERAFGSPAGGITDTDLNLALILDERGRELYWECHRRTDLVRFGQLTDGDYVWTWKGNVQAGTQTPAYRNIFPIPSSDLGSNPNLVQNEGY